MMPRSSVPQVARSWGGPDLGRGAMRSRLKHALPARAQIEERGLLYQVPLVELLPLSSPCES
jgi:hypothetical protein